MSNTKFVFKMPEQMDVEYISRLIGVQIRHRKTLYEM